MSRRNFNPKNIDKAIIKYLNTNHKLSDIINKYDIKRSTFYKYLKIYKTNNLIGGEKKQFDNIKLIDDKQKTDKHITDKHLKKINNINLCNQMLENLNNL